MSPVDEDAVMAIVDRARETVLRAADAGWSGPPFDPLQLADILGIPTRPRVDILDARTVPHACKARVLIEYNPNRPRGRMRYSIAHEIAHTFFPDCAEQVRYRYAKDELHAVDRRLEMLCNIAAAELLMPAGSFLSLAGEQASVRHLVGLAKHFDVSLEALFLRFVRLSAIPCAMFVASSEIDAIDCRHYRIDYAVGARNWEGGLPRQLSAAAVQTISECTGVGFTAIGHESFGSGQRMRLECVGLPPYPGSVMPRVLGFLACPSPASKEAGISYLVGDALEPRGAGERLIAHVVNDKTPTWGGGFALGVRARYPVAQTTLQADVRSGRMALSLGNVHCVRVATSLSVFSMVAQHGYGPSDCPRIRYAAMERCLMSLGDVAAKERASVHMPRIGCGQAAGQWSIVSELIGQHVCRRGVEVVVYDLPGGERATRRA